jgi:hypothetical protein
MTQIQELKPVAREVTPETTPEEIAEAIIAEAKDEKKK